MTGCFLRNQIVLSGCAENYPALTESASLRAARQVCIRVNRMRSGVWDINTLAWLGECLAPLCAALSQEGHAVIAVELGAMREHINVCLERQRLPDLAQGARIYQCTLLVELALSSGQPVACIPTDGAAQ